MKTDPHQADSSLKLALRVGDSRFALNADDVGEVLRAPRLTRVPNAPAALDGVASLRGAVIPVFSLTRLLALPDADGSHALVVVLANGAMGVRVDEVAPLRAGEPQLDAIQPLDVQKIAAAQLQRGARQPSRAFATAQPQPVARLRDIPLLGFTLAGQTYALPLAEVDEALAAPASAHVSPRRSAADLGVMLVRDAVTPLVSLRALLGLPPEAAQAVGRHVIVMRLGGGRVGFVVDRLTGVLRAREDAISPAPSLFNRQDSESRIASIFRSDDGRLVSILSPDGLFADPDIVRRLSQSGEETTTMQPDTANDAREQIVVFRLGEEEFGLPLTAVDEIARVPETIARVPRAPAFIRGVMNLRGRIVPLIDQRTRFGVPGETSSSSARRRVIVARLGELEAGFIVDDVREILSLDASQTQPAPALGSDETPTFDRVATLDVDGRLILLVEPRELLNRAERDTLADASWLHPAQDRS